MDTKTRAAFVAHIQKLELEALAGNDDALRSLACMALLADGERPDDPNGGCEIIDLSQWRAAA